MKLSRNEGISTLVGDLRLSLAEWWCQDEVGSWVYWR
ncbi:unnamed protein product [Brassica rapa subsp. trilocularis]|uniref:Uncharacterized protein n=1 Tax=Brassica campestris TaxID=3711 RepID=A0A3P6C609_BRACM|nr:unnamed protein product [Brassica rapa]